MRAVKLLPVLLALASLAGAGLAGCSKRPPKKKESRPKPRIEESLADEPPGGEPAAGEAAPGDEELARILEKLASPRASRRKEALNALIAMPDHERARKASAAVQEALVDDVAEVRSLAGIAMLKIHGKEGSHSIRPLLKDSNVTVRAAVLDELGKLGKDFSTELMKGLEDPSPEIQEIVLDHLSRQKLARADLQVVALFEKTESPRVRAQILKFLLDVKSKRGVRAVAKALDDLENAHALTLAVRYLGEHGQPSHARDLVFFLNDRAIGVRREAARAMGKQGLKTLDAIAGLVQLLEDDEPEVRQAAHWSLKKLTNQNFGFDPREQDAKKVEPAVKKWRDWLEKNRGKLAQQ